MVPTLEPLSLLGRESARDTADASNPEHTGDAACNSQGCSDVDTSTPAPAVVPGAVASTATPTPEAAASTARVPPEVAAPEATVSLPAPDVCQGSGSVQLGGLTNLELLYLSNNQLSGPIPAELGSLTDLRHLQLHANQLSGADPG